MSVPRPERLRARGAFVRVQSQGRRARGERLVVLAAPNALGVAPRVGFTVSRKVGNAVVRNRVRRRLRELVRKRAGEFVARSDYVIIAYPKAATATFAELAEELSCLLEKLRGRASRPSS